MERATAGGGAGRRVIAFAIGQTHQCGFPQRRLNPAGQYHDARAGRGGAATRRTAAAAIDAAGDCTTAVAASDPGGIAHGGGSQKTGGAEVLAEARSSGSACAGRTGSCCRQRLRRLGTAGFILVSNMISGQTAPLRENRFPHFADHALTSLPCRFISSSLPSVAIPSRN